MQLTLTFNGTLYDVEFVEGTCIALFDGCDSVTDFTFTDQVSAEAATSALLRDVFIDDVSLGNFDSNPDFTNGCQDPNSCFAFTPWDLTAIDVLISVASNMVPNNEDEVIRRRGPETTDTSQISNGVWGPMERGCDGGPDTEYYIIIYEWSTRVVDTS